MKSPAPPITNTKLVEIIRTYWAWRRLWMATTVVFAGIGLVYVLFLKKDVWTASQGLIVRDEANGAVMRLGRFQSQTEMKAAQETILEMARNTQVLRDALLEVGPATNWFGSRAISEKWPSQIEVTELANEAITVRAPKGAEFGTTEVIYLDIKQHSPQRAVRLNNAVCQALDSRLRQVRMARADGVIGELERASSMAAVGLKGATEELQKIEREAGSDLSDLRGLSEANGNGGNSRQIFEAVKAELRQLENQHAQLLTDFNLLTDTQTNPDRLLNAPASILNAHPGLKKLREGLADAQLLSSQLRGRFTNGHPLVYVATSSEKEIKAQLHAELALALSTAEKDVSNSQTRIDKLKNQQLQMEERLVRLARMRADYDNLNNEVRARTQILQDAERQLAEARAARDAANSTSLLTRLDEAVLGERPVGPGRSTILAGLTLSGLMLGFGIVFLLTPLDNDAPESERWNEALGRRISDRFPWLADADSNSPKRRKSDYERRNQSRAPKTESSEALKTTPTLSDLAALAPVAIPQNVIPSEPQDVQSKPTEVSPVPKGLPKIEQGCMEANSEDEALVTEPFVSNESKPSVDASPVDVFQELLEYVMEVDDTVDCAPVELRNYTVATPSDEPGKLPLEPKPASSEDACEPTAVAESPRTPKQIMFRPNQGAKPSSPRTAAPSPAIMPQLSAPNPKNNCFDSPIEGGLAGIGLPTQPLPEGINYRNY